MSILRRKILSNEWIHNQCRIDLKGGETTENASTSGKGKVDIRPDNHSGQDLLGDTAHLKNVEYDLESTEIHKCLKRHAMELLIIQIINMISDVHPNYPFIEKDIPLIVPIHATVLIF